MLSHSPRTIAVVVVVAVVSLSVASVATVRITERPVVASIRGDTRSEGRHGVQLGQVVRAPPGKS